jgi:desampylase
MTAAGWRPTALVLSGSMLRRLEAAGEAAYPDEACDLLVGRREGSGRVRISRIVESPNRAAEPTRRFEIDPRMMLDLELALRHSDEKIVASFHSHPDHAAVPSPRDLAAAWDDELAWVITAVAAGRAGETAAFALTGGAQGTDNFTAIPLLVQKT